MLRNTPKLVPLLVMLAAACGGRDAGRPGISTGSAGAPAEGDPCAADDGLEFERDPEQKIEFNFDTGLPTGWWASLGFFGGSEVDQWMYPEVLEVPDGRCGSDEYAFRVRATGLWDWGGAFGVNFQLPNGAALDRRPFDGISFWARREPTVTNDYTRETFPTGTTMFVGVSDRNTDELLQDPEAPFCKPKVDAVSDRELCDRFGASIGLTEEWKFYAFRFSELRQRGYGATSPGLLDEINGLNISFDKGAWSVWFDDFAFFTDPSGEAGAGGGAGAGAGGAAGSPAAGAGAAGSPAAGAAGASAGSGG